MAVDPLLPQSAWESWVRPVLVIAVAGAVGALGWFEVIPDAALGLVVLLAAAVVPTLLVVVQATGSLVRPRRRAAAAVAVLGSLAVAAVVPWQALGPDAVLAEGAIEHDGGSLALPEIGSGESRYVFFIHGEPGGSSPSAEVDLRLLPTGARRPRVHTAQFTTAKQVGLERRAQGTDHHDLSWPLKADLSRGAGLTAAAKGSGRLRWPILVSLHGVPAGVAPLLLAGLPFLLLGLWLDATCRSVRRSRLAMIAGGAIALGVLFGQLYVPGGATRAAVISVLLAGVAGAAPALLLTSIARRILGVGADGAAAKRA